MPNLSASSYHLPAACCPASRLWPLTPLTPDPSLCPQTAPAALTRKESYKDQRRRYRHEKRRAADELLSTVRDPAVLVRADWLKVRGTLKSWTKFWCVLKPGLLVLYKSEKAKVRCGGGARVRYVEGW